MAIQDQVQDYSRRVRRRSEQLRDLIAQMKDDRAAIDPQIYAHLNGGGQWTDSHDGGPPNLLVGNDLLALNALEADVIAYVEGNGQYPIALKACVRPLLDRD